MQACRRQQPLRPLGLLADLCCPCCEGDTHLTDGSMPSSNSLAGPPGGGGAAREVQARLERQGRSSTPQELVAGIRHTVCAGQSHSLQSPPQLGVAHDHHKTLWSLPPTHILRQKSDLHTLPYTHLSPIHTHTPQLTSSICSSDRHTLPYYLCASHSHPSPLTPIHHPHTPAHSPPTSAPQTASHRSPRSSAQPQQCQPSIGPAGTHPSELLWG